MAKFVLIYSGGSMADTPEAQQAAMAAWGEWLGGIGAATLDMGNPFAGSASVSEDGSVAGAGGLPASGYTIVTADSLVEAAALGKGCPIFASGGALDVYEAIEM